MTVKYQISDRRGEAILLVSAEGPGEHADLIYGAFVVAAQSAGLDSVVNSFSDLPGAVANVQAVFPTASVTAASGPPSPWGQPPVAPYQAPPQVPAAAYQPPGQPAGETCHHGPMTFREGTGKTGKPYKAWFCPSRSSDPTQCDPKFIR